MPTTAKSNSKVSPPQLPFIFQIMVGLPGFREGYLVSDQETRDGRRWGQWLARRGRYEVYWSHYESNVYRQIHTWSDILKAEFQLYQYTRTIASPAYRIGEFWGSHLLGGQLDPGAGDGKGRSSALPIVTKNEALRPAIAQIWRDSNFQANKDVLARHGSVLGDAFLKVVDDEARQKVYLQVVHPQVVETCQVDPFGNVKGYIFQKWWPDPRFPEQGGMPVLMEVTSTEIATKSGAAVHFQTYLDGQPWDWRDYPDDNAPRIGPEWFENYGFVPLVKIQHRDMGLGWGWGELHPSLSKMHEIDDVASKMDDQVRKLLEVPWFFSGVQAADLSVVVPEPTDAEPEPGRSRIPTVYANKSDARAMPLVAPLDIGAVAALVRQLAEELERDHPELQADMATASGDASGRALRVARERVEAMVINRRTGYDDAITRAHMMAISIGAMKQYPGFEAFDEGSFDRGDLAHTIGDRPVFATDEIDHIESEQLRANLLKTLVDAGVPLETAMARADFPKDEIQAAMKAKDAAAAAGLKAAQQQQQVALSRMGRLPSPPVAGPAGGGSPSMVGTAGPKAVGGNGTGKA